MDELINRLTVFAKMKVNKDIDKTELNDIARRLHELDSKIFPKWLKEAGIKEKQTEKPFTIDEWKRELLRPGSIRSIISWIDSTEMDIIDARRAV